MGYTMRKDYEEDLLKKVQNAELSVLKDFMEVCKKREILFFGLYGTCIGALRHQGFIPWDDDIDIGMLRADYIRFLDVVEEELGDRYHLSSPFTEPKYGSCVVKLQRKGTKFVPPYAAKAKCELGIHIDLFIYDHISDEEKEAVRQAKRARFLAKLMFLKSFRRPNIPYRGVMGRVLRALCTILHGILQVLPVSSEFLYRRFENNALKYDSKPTKYYTTFQTFEIMEERLTLEDIFPLIEVPFEDIMIPLICNYDCWLRKIYGDYRKVPPLEQRVNHAPIIVEFAEEEGRLDETDFKR